MQRPNILFIMTDDQFQREFNVLPNSQSNGVPRNLTPNMDRLIREGVWFDNMYASSTVCTPSRYSVLTGRYACRSKASAYQNGTKLHSPMHVIGWNTHVAREESHIAPTLEKAGYFRGYVGKNHAYEAAGGDFGKQRLRDRLSEIESLEASNPEVTDLMRRYQREAVESLKTDFGYDYARRIYRGNVSGQGPGMEAFSEHNMEWIVEGALECLDEAKKSEKPFFMHLATTLMHGPHSSRGRWLGDARVTPAGMLEEPPNVAGYMPPRETIPERLKAAGKNHEDPTICDMLWLDDGIGALLKKLGELELLENTVIFFFNDQGMELSSKGSLYEGAAHTQAFVWGHEGPKGVRTDSLASNIDFTPTILELAGVPKDDWHEVDGASLVPILKDPTATVRDSVFLDMGLARAVVRDDFKYLAIRESSYIRDSTREMRISMIEENQKSKGPNSACLGPDADWGHQGLVPGGGLRPEIQCRQKHAHYADRDQLYDLRKDPEEQTNLFDNPEYEAVVEKLRLELEEHLAALPDSYAEFK